MTETREQDKLISSETNSEVISKSNSCCVSRDSFDSEARQETSTLTHESGDNIHTGQENSAELEQSRAYNCVGSCPSFLGKFKTGKPRNICLIVCLITVMLCGSAAVLYYTIKNQISLSSEDLEIFSSQHNQSQVTKYPSNLQNRNFLDDNCSYETVWGNETVYNKFKNNTSIILKLNSIHDDLRVVAGITNHKYFPSMPVSALLEITRGKEGMELKGTADNYQLNSQDSWAVEQLPVYPSVENILILNFSVIENKLNIQFSTKNSSTVLTLYEYFFMSEDLRIKIGTSESDVPYQVCFLDP
ncbi:unnamed protein product [Meganyctiphanes norvegica]|uniref:Uncharacterized protein n=1 Tax=Meganyctiphanes norvegica TaxID=48144 RepID=A0AAV2PYX0_MEGNR